MTPDRRRARCAFPPHPADPDRPAGEQLPAELVPSSALRRFTRWVRHAPAERLPLPAVPGLWTAAEVLHLAHVAGVYPGAATVAAACAVGYAGERRARRSEHPRLAGAEAAAVTGAAGAWTTAATIAGPLGGPNHLLSILYGAAAGGGYWWLRRHHAVKAARARRDAAARWRARKAAWHRLAPALRLAGSHLLDHTETLLGESLLIDVRGTGKLASQISGREVAERYGEIEMIPKGRIEVTEDRIPGRLRITIRRKDPWASPVMHPAATGALDTANPYARFTPYPASIRDPLTIGIDPETGRPLQVALWDKRGGKVVQISAKKDGGKTTLLDSLTERITACPDAVLLQINLSKALEDGWWAPLAAASALDRELAKARRILTFVNDVIRERPRSGRATRVHQPTAAQPLFVVKVDEFDVVAADPACNKLLQAIDSKCRSEGVAIVKAGQRATAQWSGGGSAQANTDLAIWGKFARGRERGHVAGADTDLPDMGEYGEGASGVFAVAELPYTGSHAKGRTFYWGEEAPGLQALVANRAKSRHLYQLEPALERLAGSWAKITSPGSADPDGQDEHDSDTGDPEGLDEPGTAQITAKIGHARDLAAATPAMAPIPPQMQQHAASVLAERRRQFFDQYTDICLPGTDQQALKTLLAAPAGISTRAAAAALPWSHTRVHQQLQRWQREGITELRGKGSARRWHLTSQATHDPTWDPASGGTTQAASGAAGTAAPAAGYPPLRAIPDTPSDNPQ